MKLRDIAPIRIHRGYNDRWFWDCGCCHFGYNIPWDEESTHAEAIAAVDAHIKRHRELGTVETWANALERR